MMSSEILSRADYDVLKNQVQSLSRNIATRKEKMQICRQRYDVYCDIEKTYSEISKPDYLTRLVEEERRRQEQLKKKKQSR